jgi:hypothetical protein
MAQSEGSAVFETVDGVDTQGGHGVLEWLVCRMSRLLSQPAEKPISPEAVLAFDTFDCHLSFHRLKILKLRMFVSRLALYTRTRFFPVSVSQRYHKPCVVLASQGRQTTPSPYAKDAHWQRFRLPLSLGPICSARWQLLVQKP